jgi:TonB family protein
MRKNLLLIAVMISLKLSGQNDTTIYYSNLERTVDSEKNAAYYETITKKPKEKYLIKTFSRNDDKWKQIDEEKIEKETDSSFTISSKNSTTGKTTRFFAKCDSGFRIKEYAGSVLFKEGTSKLIFPLIKTGMWRQYNLLTGKISMKCEYSDNQLITNKYWISDTKYISDVFTPVEKMPEFEGGDSELLKYISDNIRYPEAPRRNKIEGTVMISFVLMSDGTIEGIKVIKKVSTELEQEAIRVVRSIPNKWKPAEIAGKKVNIPFMIPITFRLVDTYRIRGY